MRNVWKRKQLDLSRLGQAKKDLNLKEVDFTLKEVDFGALDLWLDFGLWLVNCSYYGFAKSGCKRIAKILHLSWDSSQGS